jgi:hypothetical protein
MDNGEGIVLGGGGQVQDEPDDFHESANVDESEANNNPGIIEGTTVSIGAAIDVDTKVILVFEDIFYCHQYQSKLNSLFVCILAYTIQL